MSTSHSSTTVAKWIHKGLTPLAKSLGFVHHSGSHFVRRRDPLLDVFFFDILRPDLRAFCIYYGVDAPELLQALDERLGLSIGRPSLRINEALKQQHWYSCWDEQTCLRSAENCASDFNAEAIPWFEKFSTNDDLIKAYFRKEMANSFDQHDVRSPGAAMRWAIYGFMLLNAGRKNEAKGWLQRAYADFQRPLFTDGRKFSIVQFSGSRKAKRADIELKIADLIQRTGLI
jgi:hypothetical protein